MDYGLPFSDRPVDRLRHWTSSEGYTQLLVKICVITQLIDARASQEGEMTGEDRPVEANTDFESIHDYCTLLVSHKKRYKSAPPSRRI